MPANSKYYSSNWARFSKIVAAVLGGYLATMLFHYGIVLNLEDLFTGAITIVYSSFIMWVALMTAIFWIKKPWVGWVIILSISLFGGLLIFLS
ncbi:MAG: hypothetical protein AAGC85_26585 [Bacteroidota bacterium]